MFGKNDMHYFIIGNPRSNEIHRTIKNNITDTGHSFKFRIITTHPTGLPCILYLTKIPSWYAKPSQKKHRHVFRCHKAVSHKTFETSSGCFVIFQRRLKEVLKASIVTKTEVFRRLLESF